MAGHRERVFNGTVWKTIGSVRRAGAAGMFAIDITDPATMGAGSVLWDSFRTSMRRHGGQRSGQRAAAGHHRQR